MTHALTEGRSKAHRWVYLLCAGILVVFAFFSAGEGGLIGALPYVPFIALCTVQFLRPTLLGWILLTAMFAAYAIAVAAHWKSLTRLDLEVFLSAGLVPAVVLLFFRPKRLVGPP
jgi:hypothetical protein